MHWLGHSLIWMLRGVAADKGDETNGRAMMLLSTWLVSPTRGSIPVVLAEGRNPLELRRLDDGSPMLPRPRLVAATAAVTGGGRIPSWAEGGGGLGLLRSELLFMHMLTMCSFRSFWIGALLVATVWRQS